MKRNMIAAAMCVSLSCLTLSSCQSDDSVKVGILQVITHDALNMCQRGIKEGLNESGYSEGKNITYDIQIPEGEEATQNSMAANLVTNSDLTIGISSSSSLALKAAIEDQGKSEPEIFCAVTDPVAAGLIDSLDSHPGITGTTDQGPTAKNIGLFKCFPSIARIGVVYNLAEPNSIVQVSQVQQACADLGLSLIDGGITASNEISTMVQGMIAKGIQGLFVPVDNTVAAAMSSIKDIIEENNIVTVCGDASEISNGGSLGYGTDYYSLGMTTGKMAALILGGESPDSIPVFSASVFNLYLRQSFFDETGIAIPQQIADLTAESV